MPTISLDEALDQLQDRLRAESAQAEAEAAHRASPGVSGYAPVTLLCVANIAGGPDLTIVYRDQDGVTSIRHITVQAIERCLNGATCVQAWDHDRMAPRKFRLERIQAAATERREVAAVEWAD